MTLRELVTAIVESVIGPRVDYARTYLARVVEQRADGTLDLVPVGTTVIPSLTAVPVYYGVPGVSAKIATGARVILTFAAGDPSLPYATVWESASVTEVTLKADKVRLGDGSRNVAREGDPVALIITPAVATAVTSGSGAITGYILRGGPGVTAP